jgi:hypothetical protein
MADLKAQEVFSSGEWNGTKFTDADLDAMVSSFDAMGLAGRVPLKFGHDSPKPDGQPALGWVSRVWRDGSKLLADFSNVSEGVLGLIRDKAYKFVSVELLKNVRAGTRSVPWVLDAVALLGADQPAIGILKELTMSSRAGLRFDARVAFTARGNLMSGDHKRMDDIERLRAENRALQQKMAEQIIEQAINCGDCLPAVRVSYGRNYGPELRTAETAKEWVTMNKMPAHQRAKYSQRPTTFGNSNDERRLPDGDEDAIGDAYRSAAKRLNIADPFNASQASQYAIWCAVRQSNPTAYSAYATSPGVS